MNKDNTIPDEKNKVFTPDEISKALSSLPFNYVILTCGILERWKEEGKIAKTYSKTYVIKVQRGRAFNEHIMNALVEVGNENFEIRNKFGRITKKASPSN